MQLHELKPAHAQKDKKRVGRGGKRGTFSGHGSKGQKARAGHRIRPGFRGGDNPYWKLFPKQRGATKKVEVKHAYFQVHTNKPASVNLQVIEEHFNTGDTVSKGILIKKGIIKTGKNGVKILGTGELTKKVTFEGVVFSATAREKITKQGSVIK